MKLYYPVCQTYIPTDFQKVDQHAGSKWLIHDTKGFKDNRWNIINLNLRRELQWNFDRNSDIFIQEISESVVCEMASILSRPGCVNAPVVTP